MKSGVENSLHAERTSPNFCGVASDSERNRTIWLVNMHFPPSTAPTGVLLESLAVCLEEADHQVRVIAGRTEYNPGEPISQRRYRGAVTQLWSTPLQPKSKFGKLLSWATFHMSLSCFLLTHRLPTQIVMMTTPPFIHVLIVLRTLLSRHNTKLILWNQDTYPDVLIAVGLVRANTWIDRIFSRLQTWATSRVDDVIVLDNAMADKLSHYGAHSLKVIPNWETISRQSSPLESDLDRFLAWTKESYRCLVLYTGNYGHGHDLETLWQYLDRDPNQKHCYLLFVGGGDRWMELIEQKQPKYSDCMKVMSYLPRPQYESLLSYADMGLVALNDNCAGMISPSKIHSYLANGIPLLYLGPSSSNVAEAIEQFGCGVQIHSGDVAELADTIVRMATDEMELCKMKSCAFHAFERCYSDQVGPNRILEEVLGITGSRRAV